MKIEVSACPAIRPGDLLVMKEGVPVYTGFISGFAQEWSCDQVFVNPKDLAVIRKLAECLK